MGNAQQRNLSSQLPPDPRTYIQFDLPKFQVHSKLGNGKFMKSYHMRVDGVSLVVKVYVKSPDEDIQSVSSRCSNIWRVLSPMRHPYILPYQMWIKSNTKLPRSVGSPVYLIRQYFMSNLYERLSTRPFLVDIEKIWIIYQLLRCMEVVHSYKIIHGDIKLENLLVTSWNWLVLTDFASFKPIALPDDDPTDFQYFFDTMHRQRCSIAPERFYKRTGTSGDYKDMLKTLDDELKTGSINTAAQSMNTGGENIVASPLMDVFSCGCAIAEMYLDGEPLMDLAAMVKYIGNNETLNVDLDTNIVSGDTVTESPVKSILNRISNPKMRKLILHMTRRDPARRNTISDYLKSLQSDDDSEGFANSMPSYFQDVLYPLFMKLQQGIGSSGCYKSTSSSSSNNANAKGLNVTADERVAIVCEAYGEIVREIGHFEDPIGCLFYESISTNYIKNHHHAHYGSKNKSNGKAEDSLHTPRKESGFSKQASPNPDDMSIEELMAECRGMIEQYEEFVRNREEYLNEPSTELPSGTSNAVDVPSVTSLMDSCAKVAQYANHASHFDQSLLNTEYVDAATDGDSKCSGSNKKTNDVSKESEGLLLVVQVLCANIRHVKYPSMRIVALTLLVRFGVHISSSLIIQRVIPSIVVFLSDYNEQSPAVRAMAIRCLTALLQTIHKVTPFEAHLFPHYIFPALVPLCKDPEVHVRLAFAECIGRIAELSKRFLDYSYLDLQNKTVSVESVQQTSSQADGILIPNGYDAKLKVLQENVGRWIRDLIDSAASFVVVQGGAHTNVTADRGDSSTATPTSIIKRALLSDIMRLCVFFGEVGTVDMLLIQLLTYLNDQDWELRREFCIKIPCVCAFLGTTITSDCILPCIENALVDIEEMVVVQAIRCITTLVELELLRKSSILECIQNTSCLLLHPCYSVRDQAIELILAVSKYFGPLDTVIYVLPYIRPCLHYDLLGVDLTRENLKYALITPISRVVYRDAVYSKSIYASSYSNEGDSVNIVDLPPQKKELQLTADLESSSAIEACTVNGSEDEKDVSSANGTEESNKFKLELMKQYIDRASAELTSKTMQWRNGSGFGASAGNNVSGNGSQLSQYGINNPHIVSLSSLGNQQINANNVLAHSKNVDDWYMDGGGTSQSRSQLAVTTEHAATQSLYVPNQKYGIYQSILEEYRLLAFDCDPASTVARLKMLYGVMLSRVEAERSLSIAYGLELSEGAPGTVHPSTERGVLLQRIKSLNIPPVSADLGSLVQPDGRKYNSYVEALDTSTTTDTSSRASWRPRENVLVSTLAEHSAAVNRIAISPDQTYFITASDDKTARVWPTRNLDRYAFPRSVCMYTGHKGKISDIVPIENSHGVVSCSVDGGGKGSIHLWRVDVASGGHSAATNVPPATQSEIFSSQDAVSTPVVKFSGHGNGVTGLSVVKTIDTEEYGGVNNLLHYNGDVASMVLYSTEKGGVHGWDMRAYRDAFQLPVRPELGSITSMTAAPDRNWICVGTSEGYISLYDIRYNMPCKLYEHSSKGPIHRLACCKSIPKVNMNFAAAGAGAGAGVQGATPQQTYKEVMPYTEGAYLFVAAGQNESAVWGIPEGGECHKCFRSVPMSSGRARYVSELPFLTDIPLPRHPMSVIPGTGGLRRQQTSRALNQCEPSVRAIIGRISQSGSSYLVTAGTDRQIRFWDFSSPSRCFTISGLELGQPKSSYESPNMDKLSNKLYVSYDTALPSSSTLVQAHMPYWENRGPINPINKYKDAILDLKIIDLPVRMLVAGGRDGIVKLWR